MSKIALSGNASGTGTLTIAAPNTNSDRTLTLPDNSGTVFTNAGGTMTGALALPAGGLNVGSGQLAVDASGRVTMPYQPSFFGYYNGSSLGPSNTPQKLDLVVVTSNGGHYSSGNFTCPVAGYYYCTFAGATIYGTLGALDISIRKNGSAVSSAYAYSATANEYNAGSCSAVISCAANDTIEFWKNSSSTNSFQSGPAYSSASIMLIG